MKKLNREIYIHPSDEDATWWLSAVGYIDANFTRQEIISVSSASDVYRDHRLRISTDNGETWTEKTPLHGLLRQEKEGGMVTYPGNYYFERQTGILYQILMRRIWPGMRAFTMSWDTDVKHPFRDYTFVVENGRIEKLMKYEDGSGYNHENSFAPEFLKNNQAYSGNSIVFSAGGAAYLPLCCVKKDQSGNYHNGLVLMRRNQATGEWAASNQQYIGLDLSSRGLLEPDAAILSDQRIFIVCRGSNTPSTPGRKWFSISADNGETISAIKELRFDDGSPFYSPSSIHRLIRSTKNGKLYWLANIVPDPPAGNRPRYPLYLCEIDEENVAVKKESLIIVDARTKDEPELIQFSNFQLMEDRKTLNIEIYLSRLGENHVQTKRSGVYKYLYTPEIIEK